MDDLKHWYQSRTVWGAIVAILASLAQAFGLGLNAGQQADLAEALLALSGAMGGLLALYGRFKAETRIAPPK